MQTTPALPWEEGYGGIIRLAEPLTDEQLIDGALIFDIMSEGQHDDDVRVVRVGETDTLQIMAGSDTIFNLVNNGRTLQLTYADPSIDNHALVGVTLA